MKKWSWKKKSFVSLVLIFLIIQIFLPAKNDGERYGPNDYTNSLSVSPEIKNILEASCFDCHSNKTNHRWYENIQPFGWWMSSHITEGKEELNFSEFNTYPNKKKAHKLEETAEMVKEGEMPLNSYLWMHDEAELSEAQRKLVEEWALTEMKKFETATENK